MLLTRYNEEVDAVTSAQEFVRGFEAEHGACHPPWVASSWRDAAVSAGRQHKFLMVYLHAAHHQVLLLFTAHAAVTVRVLYLHMPL